jgi:hypothetical protein
VSICNWPWPLVLYAVTSTLVSGLPVPASVTCPAIAPVL